MARARVTRDDRGRLCVEARGRLDGKELKRRKIIPGADEDLARELAKMLNLQFATGDLSRLVAKYQKPAAKPARPRTSRTLGDWASEWLESYLPPRSRSRPGRTTSPT